MRETLTVSLSPEMKVALDKLTRQEGLSRSDVVRESLRNYLFLRQFRALRAKMTAKAKVQGIYTDQDVFDRTS
jgi:Arc/MetJ-type ribon-helix-helix transcriptional regulator